MFLYLNLLVPGKTSAYICDFEVGVHTQARVEALSSQAAIQALYCCLAGSTFQLYR